MINTNKIKKLFLESFLRDINEEIIKRELNEDTKFIYVKGENDIITPERDLSEEEKEFLFSQGYEEKEKEAYTIDDENRLIIKDEEDMELVIEDPDEEDFILPQLNYASTYNELNNQIKQHAEKILNSKESSIIRNFYNKLIEERIQRIYQIRDGLFKEELKEPVVLRDINKKFLKFLKHVLNEEKYTKDDKDKFSKELEEFYFKIMLELEEDKLTRNMIQIALLMHEDTDEYKNKKKDIRRIVRDKRNSGQIRSYQFEDEIEKLQKEYLEFYISTIKDKIKSSAKSEIDKNIQNYEKLYSFKEINKEYKISLKAKKNMDSPVEKYALRNKELDAITPEINKILDRQNNRFIRRFLLLETFIKENFLAYEMTLYSYEQKTDSGNVTVISGTPVLKGFGLSADAGTEKIRTGELNRLTKKAFENKVLRQKFVSQLAREFCEEVRGKVNPAFDKKLENFYNKTILASKVSQFKNNLDNLNKNIGQTKKTIKRLNVRLEKEIENDKTIRRIQKEEQKKSGKYVPLGQGRIYALNIKYIKRSLERYKDKLEELENFKSSRLIEKEKAEHGKPESFINFYNPKKLNYYKTLLEMYPDSDHEESKEAESQMEDIELNNSKTFLNYYKELEKKLDKEAKDFAEEFGEDYKTPEEIVKANKEKMGEKAEGIPDFYVDIDREIEQDIDPKDDTKRYKLTKSAKERIEAEEKAAFEHNLNLVKKSGGKKFTEEDAIFAELVKALDKKDEKGLYDLEVIRSLRLSKAKLNDLLDNGKGLNYRQLSILDQSGRGSKSGIRQNLGRFLKKTRWYNTNKELTANLITDLIQKNLYYKDEAGLLEDDLEDLSSDENIGLRPISSFNMNDVKDYLIVYFNKVVSEDDDLNMTQAEIEKRAESMVRTQGTELFISIKKKYQENLEDSGFYDDKNLEIKKSSEEEYLDEIINLVTKENTLSYLDILLEIQNKTTLEDKDPKAYAVYDYIFDNTSSFSNFFTEILKDFYNSIENFVKFRLYDELAIWFRNKNISHYKTEKFLDHNLRKENDFGLRIRNTYTYCTKNKGSDPNIEIITKLIPTIMDDAAVKFSIENFLKQDLKDVLKFNEAQKNKITNNMLSFSTSFSGLSDIIEDLITDLENKETNIGALRSRMIILEDNEEEVFERWLCSGDISTSSVSRERYLDFTPAQKKAFKNKVSKYYTVDLSNKNFENYYVQGLIFGEVEKSKKLVKDLTSSMFLLNYIDNEIITDFIKKYDEAKNKDYTSYLIDEDIMINPNILMDYALEDVSLQLFKKIEEESLDIEEEERELFINSLKSTTKNTFEKLSSLSLFIDLCYEKLKDSSGMDYDLKKNSIFENRKIKKCFIDLNNYGSTLISEALENYFIIKDEDFKKLIDGENSVSERVEYIYSFIKFCEEKFDESKVIKEELLKLNNDIQKRKEILKEKLSEEEYESIGNLDLIPSFAIDLEDLD